MAGYSTFVQDRETTLDAVYKLLSPNEALIQHVVVVGMGLVTTCVTSGGSTFNVKSLDAAGQQQFTIDQKLLNNAVHNTNDPALDASFPMQSAYRLYQNLFGGVEACLANKSHILIATDPDFFALP
jgi:hypothetical protein